jgi:hypothetical protein
LHHFAWFDANISAESFSSGHQQGSRSLG